MVLFLCFYVVKFRNKHYLVFYEYKKVCHLYIQLFKIPRKTNSYTLTNRIKGSNEYIAALRPAASSLKTK